MVARIKLTTGLGLALSVVLAGCGAFQVTNLMNPDFLSSLGLGASVATLPGDAPGLLVTAQNSTDRSIAMAISYRDVNDKVQSYTASIAPGDKTAQMLVCPVKEITIGDVSNLSLSGARVFLVGSVTDPNAIGSAPYVEVEPFGVLLKEGVNYDCGDGLTFTVQASTQTRSGYQTIAYIRRSGQ
jgi:hypothetical protein